MSELTFETISADQKVRWVYLLHYLAQSAEHSVPKVQALKDLNHEAACATYGLGDAKTAKDLLEKTFAELIVAKLVTFVGGGKTAAYALTEDGKAAAVAAGPPLPLLPTKKELAAQEKARLAAEKAAAVEAKLADKQRLAAEKERLAAEKIAEKERLAAEKERLAAEKIAEKERLAADKERLAAEKEQLAAEKARLAAEKIAEKERLAAEKIAEKERKAEEARQNKAAAAEAKRLAAEAKAAEAKQAQRDHADAARTKLRTAYFTEHADRHAQHEQAVLFSTLTVDDAPVDAKPILAALKNLALAKDVFEVVVPLYFEKGWLTQAGTAKTSTYQLTPAGLTHLAALDFPDVALKPAPTGAQLNKLLRAARTLTSKATSPSLAPVPEPIPEVAAAILDAVRQETANGKLARIPAIRQAVAVAPELFDATLLQLHTEQRLRLSVLSDRRAYPAEELNAGIHSHGNIYFFVELTP